MTEGENEMDRVFQLDDRDRTELQKINIFIKR